MSDNEEDYDEGGAQDEEQEDEEELVEGDDGDDDEEMDDEEEAEVSPSTAKTCLNLTNRTSLYVFVYSKGDIMRPRYMKVSYTITNKHGNY